MPDGAGTYAATVAALAGKPVYASTGLFGAGDEVTSLKHIKAPRKKVCRQ
jgi:hypothetical protein